MKTNIGFIGLGLMGAPMALRILKAGHPLAIHNRTKEKAQDLLKSGARWCDSPKQVAHESEIVFSMLSDSEVLEAMAMGPHGILAGLGTGGIHIDTSTVSPTTTVSLAERYASESRFFLHSPVLGSIPQATDGSLLLFVGGDQGAFHRSEPILKILGSKIWRFENVDEATNTKLLCNFFIASMISTLAQALVFAKTAGIGPRVFLKIISYSALNAPMYQAKGSSIIERNFSPRFFLEHMLKDVNLIVQAAENLRVTMPSAEVAQALFSQAVRHGLAREDYSAIVKILEQAASVEVK